MANSWFFGCDRLLNQTHRNLVSGMEYLNTNADFCESTKQVGDSIVSDYRGISDSARVWMDDESGAFLRTCVNDPMVWLRRMVFDRI
jgi:hypothetical protein